MTLTGIMADSSLAGGSNPRLVRRILAVLTMFAGAFAGEAVVLNRGIVPALGVAAFIMATVSASAWLLSRGNPAWVHAA